MKTKKEEARKTVRNKYTSQFKEQALERADRDGIPKVAQDLGLAEAMLYSWRTKRRNRGLGRNGT
ncbi:transposase [Methyloglobulus sp.]|uniref:transposase n=1 Tax=Methyloglobulus sp. TaxID=2518622 RepID=UPI0032B7CAF1